jgi:DNA-binding protein HU-beta
MRKPRKLGTWDNWEELFVATITKKEMVVILAGKTKFDAVVCRKVFQAFLDEVVENLKQGNRLEFRHFGIFAPVVRKGRTGRNPKTKLEINVPAHVGVRFRVGQRLKRILAGLPVPELPADED